MKREQLSKTQAWREVDRRSRDGSDGGDIVVVSIAPHTSL